MYKVRDSLLEEQIAKEKSDRAMLLWFAVVIAVIMMISALNQFVFLTVQVKGQSMLPTLYSNDVLIVNRVKKVENGDIVVIEGETDYWLIKRVIACHKDDFVEIRSDGYVWVNGNQIKENYVLKQGSTNYNIEEFEGHVKLKEGEIFYLGDNRENSSDSRKYGVCTDEQIVGVVENWSLDFRQINKFLFKVREKIMGKN
ncbi:MAG: signal peptidase I [Clostridiales bacterium]|nr:signal peptidase I [Clostridiales bacterium]